jgi:hypothetical protein
MAKILTLNFDKTSFMKFATNNKIHISLNVCCDNKIIGEVFAAWPEN